MGSDSNWTGPWAAKKLRNNKNVSSVSVVGVGRLRIDRHELRPVSVATLAIPTLSGELMQRLVDSEPSPDFILNLESGASLDADALRLSLENRIPVGRMGDLERALEMEDVGDYVDRDTRFIERGLNQHSKVIRFDRIDLRRYYIEREHLSPLTAIFLNDYELGAEAVRQAREEYGSFDIVVASNPNSRVTDSAIAVAQQLDCEVYKWGPFLSRLNRES